MARCEFELGQREDAVCHLRAAVSIYHRIGAAEASSAASRLADVETEDRTGS
jgi:hypothetical protein